MKRIQNFYLETAITGVKEGDLFVGPLFGAEQEVHVTNARVVTGVSSILLLEPKDRDTLGELERRLRPHAWTHDPWLCLVQAPDEGTRKALENRMREKMGLPTRR